VNGGNRHCKCTYREAAYEINQQAATIAEQAAQLEVLRADAERYRWLCENCECLGWGNRSDAAIDAAIASGKAVTP
jgi:hypothetical protein